MLTVTEDFKDALKAPIKEVSGYIVLEDGTEILPEGDLQKFTIKSMGGFLRTAMSKIEVTLLGEHDLEGNMIDAYYGVYYDDEYHYVLKGKFEIAEASYKKDNETTLLIGYDNMQQFETEYSTVGTYPTTLFGYLQSICSLAGVVLENSEIYNGSLPITQDYYQNMSEYTIRDVLEDVCEAAASYALINSQGNLELRQVADTDETLTYENLLKYELGEYWGGINSLVLSRQPQNDDVFVRDEEDINFPTTHNILNLGKFDVGYSTEDD